MTPMESNQHVCQKGDVLQGCHNQISGWEVMQRKIAASVLQVRCSSMHRTK